MTSKPHRRLVKESLIHIYNNSRLKSSINFPVYYFSFDDKNLDSLKVAVQAMQKMPEIPWPDDDCVILCEDPFSALSSKFGKIDFFALTWVVRIKNLDILSGTKQLPHLFYLGHTILFNKQIHHIEPELVSFFKVQIDIEKKFKSHEEYLDFASDRLIRDMKKLSTNFDSEDLRKIYKDYVNRVCVSNGEAWSTFNTASKTEEPGRAADILAAMSNIMIPCNYYVHNEFIGGFGPGPIRRITEGKPILSIIPADRLYCQYENAARTLNSEIAPHFRRGHIRHFWQESGIDRLKLPDNPEERLLLAVIKKVRRKYIHPQWIGSQEFINDDCKYRIITGEHDISAAGKLKT